MYAPDKARQELTVLLAHRRQLKELYLAEQQRLSNAVTESAYQESAARLVQFSRLLAEVDDELTLLLQTPLRLHERRGLCRKAFRE